MRIEKHREQFLNFLAQNAPGVFMKLTFQKQYGIIKENVLRSQ